MKSILSLVALLAATTFAYPMYKQCDARWGTDYLNTLAACGRTLCTSIDFGSFVTCLAMALDDCDQEVYTQEVNPGNLNLWLRNNNGYIGCSPVLAKTDLLGGVQYVA